jgi:hypothetical protein
VSRRRGTGVLAWAGFALLFALFLCSSLAWLDGGALHPEVDQRLPRYLDSSKSILFRVFDVGSTDYGCCETTKNRIGCYQARELSYFLDLVESRFLLWRFESGAPTFVSFFYYLFLFLLTFLAFRFGRSTLGIPAPTLLLILALFLFSPVVFLSGSHFRTAKIGTALVVFGLLLLAFRRPPSGLRAGGKQDEERGSAAPPPTGDFGSRPRFGFIVASTLLGVVAGLFDKQGAFLVVLLALVSAVILVLGGRSRDASFPAAMTMATLLYLSWNRFLSPAITEGVVGYRPSFAFSQLDIPGALEADSLLTAFAYLVDQTRFLLGIASRGGAFLVLLAVAFLLHRLLVAGGIARRASVAALVVGSVSIGLMLALMYNAHPPIVWNDVKRVYYALPLLAVLLFALLLAVRSLFAIHPRLEWPTNLLLALALASGVRALPEHGRVFREGHMGVAFSQSGEILRTLRESWDPVTRTYRLDEAQPAKVGKHGAIANLLARNGGRPIPPTMDPWGCCSHPPAPKLHPPRRLRMIR